MGIDWIYGIAVVMLFGTVVLQAVPEGTYQKYVRLFLGALLMLAVFSPVFSWLGLSENTRLSFEREVLTAWLGSGSSRQEEWQAAVLEKKEAWLREPLDALVWEYGFVCLKYAVQWNEEGDWPAQLTLWVAREDMEKTGEKVNTAEGTTEDIGDDITPISSVRVVQKVGQGSGEISEDATENEENYYEPAELRSLHRALQTVWQLREEQILLYWER